MRNEVSKRNAFCTLCLDGLRTMYCRETRLFSFSQRLVGQKLVRIDRPESQLKYTLNSLMGLHKAGKAGYPLFCDPVADYQHLMSETLDALDDPEILSGALWAAVSIGAEAPARLVDSVRKLGDGSGATPLTAQAVSWMILASAPHSSPTFSMLTSLVELVMDHYVHPTTHLVRHLPTGYRKSVASFAASCYTAYALLSVAAGSSNRLAREVGLAIARSLVSLQGPQGQWAWFYSVPHGVVLDYYPVYSVHQHSMAPFFLLAALDLGYHEFREALVKGFSWILRTNESGTSMVEADRRLVWRSVERFGRYQRMARAFSGLLPGRRRSAIVDDPARLRQNVECRSYELGWGLWAFAGREDFSTILDDKAFEQRDIHPASPRHLR